MISLDKFSIGIGDRFGHQARAQLRAIKALEAQGVHVTPVWNKSNREHMLTGSRPDDTRRAADAAEAALQFICDSLDRVKKVPGKINMVVLPLHMAPYLNPKNFEKFYFPSFKKLIEAIQERGLHASIYCEHNWDPHLEALNDLPGRVQIGFEMADPKLVVEKLDKRHIISTSFLPICTATRTGDDAVKRLLILSPLTATMSLP